MRTLEFFHLINIYIYIIENIAINQDVLLMTKRDDDEENTGGFLSFLFVTKPSNMTPNN
jgi:hypothetical protein